MLAALLLVGCIVLDDSLSLSIEDEDYGDESYSYYNDDDNDDDDENKDALKLVMSGREIDDWKDDTPTLATNVQSLTTGDNNTKIEFNLTTSMKSDYDNLTSKFPSDYDVARTKKFYEITTPKTPSDYGITTPRKGYENATPKFYDYGVVPLGNDVNGTSNIDEYDDFTLTTRGEYNRLTMTRSENDNEDNFSTKIPKRTSANNQQIDTINIGLDKEEFLKYINGVMGGRYRLVTTGTTSENIKKEEDVNTSAFNESIIQNELGYVLSKFHATEAAGRNQRKTLSNLQLHRENKAEVQFDIDKFLEIISNLTYDYYTNLTEQVNDTLIKMSVPTCGTPTEEPTTTASDYSAVGGMIIEKCFVCGLEDEGIPYNAYCADAFAGDFIALVPQDPHAKERIAMYKKYCRYKNVNNYKVNSSMPRSIFGRWTGGCAVRWTDISGVYTQRTCRNRHQPTMGRHFASKRMAKLEMTLESMDNGCIISPVATLLPLSRSISLYSRFHACVCTGKWCNGARRLDSDMWMTAVMALTAVVRSVAF